MVLGSTLGLAVGAIRQCIACEKPFLSEQLYGEVLMSPAADGAWERTCAWERT